MSHVSAKGGKVQAPDYSAIAQASERAAQLSADVSREQLAWAKEQYGRDRQVTDQVLSTLLPAMQSEADAAVADRKRYVDKYQPLEDEAIADAKSFASPERQELEAGRAGAAVASSFDAQRRAAQARLESFGIDPTQTRAAALDIGTRTAQAAMTAGAENDARLQTEAVGRGMRDNAINTGKGYSAQIASAYNTSANAGNSAVGNTNATTGMGAQTMGTGAQWAGLQNQTLGQWGNQVAGLQQAAWNTNTARYGQMSSLIGSAIGGATSLAGAGMMGRAQGGPIPHDPGDPGGDQDRMAIRVSGDEFVIPASVVRAKGTDFFDRLIAQVGKKEDQQAAKHRLRTGQPGGERMPALQGV